MGKKTNDAEQKEAIEKLRKLIKPGDTVYTILRHRASSGMFRVIDLAITVPDYEETYPLKPEGEASYSGERDYSAKPTRKLRGHAIRRIGWLACQAMGDNYDSDRQGIKASGCGMDMGFNLVYNLGRTLWPKGFKCIGRDRCRANDHVNPGPSRGDYSRKHHHTDSGYALKHEWL
jgi:hypothetical protein